MLIFSVSIKAQITITILNENVKPVTEVWIVYGEGEDKKVEQADTLGFWSTENKIITDVLIFRLGYQSIELSSIKSGPHICLESD